MIVDHSTNSVSSSMKQFSEKDGSECEEASQCMGPMLSKSAIVVDKSKKIRRSSCDLGKSAAIDLIDSINQEGASASRERSSLYINGRKRRIKPMSDKKFRKWCR